MAWTGTRACATLAGMPDVIEANRNANVIANLFNSERAVLGIVLILGCTLLVALGKMTTVDWKDYTMWIFGIYVGGKSLTGAATAIAARPSLKPIEGGISQTLNVAPSSPPADTP